MKKEKFFLEKNFLSGFLICCFGIWMAAATRLTKGIYPMTVFVLMILIGAFLMVRTAAERPGNLLARVSWKELVMLLLLFINPLLAHILGFYLSAFLVIAGISWLILPKKRGKALLGVVLYSAVVAAGAYVVFTLLLKITTPTGILL